MKPALFIATAAFALALGWGYGSSAFQAAPGPGEVVGYEMMQTIDFTQREVGPTVNEGFDVTRSWTLTLEFMPLDFDAEYQMLFMWGDSRWGSDPIFVRQRGSKVEAGIWEGEGEHGTTLATHLRATQPNQWITVALDYDAEVKKLRLSLDGKTAQESPCGAPVADRPMPIHLGGAHDLQPFKGKLRNVRLANR